MPTQTMRSMSPVTSRCSSNSLQPYRTEDGFVPYMELTEADSTKLAVAIDTLAEKFSPVPAAIASAEHE